MKKLFILFVFCALFSCKSVSKEEYLSNACQCITKIDSTSQAIKNEMADCLQSNFVAYKNGAEHEVKTYLKENSDASTTDAQQFLIEALHQQLLIDCPDYKTLNDLIK